MRFCGKSRILNRRQGSFALLAWIKGWLLLRGSPEPSGRALQDLADRNYLFSSCAKIDGVEVFET